MVKQHACFGTGRHLVVDNRAQIGAEWLMGARSSAAAVPDQTAGPS
jgi:hypothetical protein